MDTCDIDFSRVSRLDVAILRYVVQCGAGRLQDAAGIVLRER
jgi:hypothetical protein